MKNIAVIGAGTMGNGIAHTFAQYDYSVNLIDISEDSLQRGLNIVQKNLDRMIAKGTIDEAKKKATLSNIKTFTDLKKGVEQVDLVVEAASEDFAIKSKI
ncbi:MAG: 3-hydroxybutyryl-CoA dehydrogenase, partial [Bacteroidetes bacterium HGW-Bacteroidetes-13]